MSVFLFVQCANTRGALCVWGRGQGTGGGGGFPCAHEGGRGTDRALVVERMSPVIATPFTPSLFPRSPPSAAHWTVQRTSPDSAHPCPPLQGAPGGRGEPSSHDPTALQTQAGHWRMRHHKAKEKGPLYALVQALWVQSPSGQLTLSNTASAAHRVNLTYPALQVHHKEGFGAENGTAAPQLTIAALYPNKRVPGAFCAHRFAHRTEIFRKSISQKCEFPLPSGGYRWFGGWATGMAATVAVSKAGNASGWENFVSVCGCGLRVLLVPTAQCPLR